jgi:hypothetical protein
MFMDQAESLIADYAVSEHFMFLDPKAKENVEPVLLAFFKKASERGEDIEDVLLNGMPRLDLSADLKRAVPGQLEGFFAFLKDTGRFPPAGAWRMCVESVKSRYLESLRADGSVKGTTFKKNYTDVGRNDPCPCGSGQKFKKCCMELIK